MGNSTTGAGAVDAAIAKGLDLDGSAIPADKLSLYNEVMGLEANRQRSGVTNSMRSRIVRIGTKHLSRADLDGKLVAADFKPLTEREVIYYYTSLSK
ncbi:MAG: DUF4090 family protein [Cyanobacteria bacterium P01_F01_bin.153]